MELNSQKTTNCYYLWCSLIKVEYFSIKTITKAQKPGETPPNSTIAMARDKKLRLQMCVSDETTLARETSLSVRD